MKHRLIVLIFGLIVGHYALAGTYTVINLNSNGDGSLLWAIEQANAGTGGDVIVFQPGLTGVINNQIFDDIIKDLTIKGNVDVNGFPAITINGGI